MYNVPLEVVLLLIRRMIQTLREEEDYEENQELSVKRVCRPQRLKCSGIQVSRRQIINLADFYKV